MKSLSRRRFVGSVGALGAAAIIPESMFEAQNGVGITGKIDVHHHLTSPAFVRFMTESNISDFPVRSPAEAIEDMDSNGIAMAFTSMIGPGIWTGNLDRTRTLARACNDWAARLMGDYPGRYGMFALLPLPDIDGSLREIEYAYETLGADGIYLYTNFGHTRFYGDQYLGDPMLAPIYEELNRRNAIIYVHPKDNLCCREVVPGVDGSTIEYGTDTTRTIVSLLTSGTAARYPNISFIFAHGGGTAPYLIGRIAGAEAAYLQEGGVVRPGAAAARTSEAMPRGPLPQMREFYYDTSSVENPVALGALRKLVPVTQILFGTDFPFGSGAASHIRNLEASGVLNPAELRAVYRDNPARLLPRLRDA